MAHGEREGQESYVQRALSLRETLASVASAAGADGLLIEILVAQALGLQAQGETDLVIDALEQAIKLAEPEGYLRTFVEEGRAMHRLLVTAASRGIALEYVAQLLEAFEDSPGVPQSGWPGEVITEREMQVLRLLATSLSSSGIADRLFVSANTVRTHVKNVCGKLDVHRRAEAHERAHELRLL